MDKKQKILIGIVAALLIAGGSFLFKQYSSNQKQVSSLKSQINDLENELKDAKEKISELEVENSELEEKLSNVQHFDQDGSVGNGYSDNAVNYTGQVIETNIDGEFEGWDGDTIFKMMNGSIWQQASYAYTYHYAYMPDVIIYLKNGMYFMKVEGVEDELQVSRLR